MQTWERVITLLTEKVPQGTKDIDMWPKQLEVPCLCMLVDLRSC